MPTPYETPIGSWTGRSTFFWAATGATVGLSNLWKFPYLAGANGGGLFVLLYLGCLLLITLPLMLTETALGRTARNGIVLAMDGVARHIGRSAHWTWIGRLSVLAGFLVLSFTAVIGAICLAYVFYSALGQFSGASEQSVARTLSNLVENPNGQRSFMIWHASFLILVAVVSVQGVVDGLERAFRVVMPALLMLLLALFFYSYRFGDLGSAVDFMLRFHPADVSWSSLQLALAHAFYTLGLGMGVWVIFGAYMPSFTPLKRSVFAVALMDTLIAIVAGLTIYGLVFNRIAGVPSQGFGLVFLDLPASLASAPGGQFVATAMFVAILLVAWTTALALLEPVVGWFQEWVGGPRGWSATIIVVAAWLAGLGTLFSFNSWSDLTLAGGTLFRWIEILTGGLLIPLVSIALAIFVGWVLRKQRSLVMIGRTPAWIAGIWFWVIKLVLPPVILFIGGHYAMVSLGALCDDDQQVEWCRGSSNSPIEHPALPTPHTTDAAPQTEPGTPNSAAKEAGLPDAAPEQVPGAKPVGPDRDKPAAAEKTESVPADDAADSRDFLYDSV
ncbi:MAG: sodium-dependent transporter [Marinobacter sp.]|nr:sodium-dependent transporter [Marinobacter sp.]